MAFGLTCIKENSVIKHQRVSLALLHTHSVFMYPPTARRSRAKDSGCWTSLRVVHLMKVIREKQENQSNKGKRLVLSLESWMKARDTLSII